MSLWRTYITSTLRSDRKYILVDVMKKKLKKGEMISRSLNDISVIKWKHKRDVHMTTNASIPEVDESVNRRENSKQKSNAIHVFNQNMRGIDQYEKNPTIQGWEKLLGGIKRWKFPFLKFSWQIHFKNTRSPKFSTVKEYKEAIVWVLIGAGKPSTKVKLEANFHYLCTIPATEWKKTATKTCKHYSTKENRKESTYQWMKCRTDQCFLLYHKKKVIAETESSSESEQDWDYLMENKKRLADTSDDLIVLFCILVFVFL